MRTKSVAALLALPLLAACAPEIESTIYVDDVVEVARGNISIQVAAILRVPQGSEDGCKDNLQNLIVNLATLAPATGKGKCVEKEGDQLAEIETEMVVATPDAPFDSKNLFVLTATSLDAGAGYELRFQLTRPIAEIVEVLATNSEEMRADFDPAKFIFTVTNNSDTSIALTGNAIFVDSRPALPGTTAIPLQPLSSAEIVFSDVASVHAEEGNPYTFAAIRPVP